MAMGEGGGEGKGERGWNAQLIFTAIKKKKKMMMMKRKDHACACNNT